MSIMAHCSNLRRIRQGHVRSHHREVVVESQLCEPQNMHEQASLMCAATRLTDSSKSIHISPLKISIESHFESYRVEYENEGSFW